VNGVRFAPPEWRWTSEQRWTLSRAFAPVGSEVPPPEDPARAVQEAQALGLAERIASRSGDERLVSELGRVVAAHLVLARTRARSRAAELLKAAREVAECAAAADIPVAPLKGAALHFGGYVPPGARPAGDVDMLVPPDRARLLSDRLEAGGWRRLPVAAADHQLPPLVDEAGRVVELHVYIPGVRLPAGGARFARFGALETAGLLGPVPAGAGGASLPSRDLLVAHVTAHAIAQHGFAPGSYPLTRALADLCDLGVAGGGNEDAWRLVVRDVGPRELAAVESLCRLLGEGELTFLAGPASAPRVLLTHAVAGALDGAYRDSLAVPALFQQLVEGSRLLAIHRKIRRSLRFLGFTRTLARVVACVRARG
jgi:hypothetical protein